MAFVLILPLTMQFFLGIIGESVSPMITVNEYFSTMTYMCLGFGALFELPVVMMGLTAIGLVNPTFSPSIAATRPSRDWWRAVSSRRIPRRCS
jgi:sec-independent protein translocase protein TatC